MLFINLNTYTRILTFGQDDTTISVSVRRCKITLLVCRNVTDVTDVTESIFEGHAPELGYNEQMCSRYMEYKTFSH